MRRSKVSNHQQGRAHSTVPASAATSWWVITSDAEKTSQSGLEGDNQCPPVTNAVSCGRRFSAALACMGQLQEGRVKSRYPRAVLLQYATFQEEKTSS
jgi:hypothetical protein